MEATSDRELETSTILSGHGTADIDRVQAEPVRTGCLGHSCRGNPCQHVGGVDRQAAGVYGSFL